MVNISFPKMVKVRQRFDLPRIDNFETAIRKELKAFGLNKKIKPGWRIAITAGSRGIAHYSKILATIVDEVKRAGGNPFLVTSMGSHGGATPRGQLEVLSSLGITFETVGAPIEISMEIDEIGRFEKEIPVYLDHNALNADGIIIVNRIKPHTDFKDDIESGLLKMIAIGLGKQKGAEMIHWHKSDGYHRLIPKVAKMIIDKTNIILGLAIVENANHEIALVKAIEPSNIENEEKKLLKMAKELIARIPFKNIDVLIVDEMGKNISGVGMDTNVTGRFWLSDESDPQAPKVHNLVVLDLTKETHGNAIGIGLADFTTRKLVEKIDYDSTYINCLTQGSSETGKIPPYLPNEREAIANALRTCGPIDPLKAKVVRIKNTLDLEYFWISESLLDEVKENNELSEKIDFIDKPRKMRFDILGTMVR